MFVSQTSVDALAPAHFRGAIIVIHSATAAVSSPQDGAAEADARDDDAEERLLADAVRNAIDWTFTGSGPHQIAVHSHTPAVLGDAQSRNVITRNLD